MLRALEGGVPNCRFSKVRELTVPDLDIKGRGAGWAIKESEGGEARSYSVGYSMCRTLLLGSYSRAR